MELQPEAISSDLPFSKHKCCLVLLCLCMYVCLRPGISPFPFLARPMLISRSSSGVTRFLKSERKGLLLQQRGISFPQLPEHPMLSSITAIILLSRSCSIVFLPRKRMSPLRARICIHKTYQSTRCRVSNQEIFAELK